MELENELKSKLSSIKSIDLEAKESARVYVDSLIKPPGSLGKLESIAVQISGITGQVHNDIDRKRIIVLCADNGVTSEGISSAPITVTASQAVNMTKRITGMSSMANHFGVDVEVVDMGIMTDYNCDEILDRKIRKGTGNIVVERAMTRDETIKAILTGIELAQMAKSEAFDILGVGEMGIGNTTTSAAVLSAITAVEPAILVGRGGGLTDKAFNDKKDVVKKAVRRFIDDETSPDKTDVIEILSQLGGLDIAAMCGVFLGASINRIPVVVDGYISVVAALCACKLDERVKEYLFPSHLSEEPGYNIAASEIGFEPWLCLDMRLGEGSGCVIAFQVIESSLAMMNNMATFEGGGINDDYLEDIRKQERLRKC